MASLETSGPDPVPSVVNTDSPCPEVAKESPLENLMDKLRSKSSQYKPWGEMSKAMRVAITEKRHIMDSTDRTHLQKVLDILQKSIKVSSLQSMIERLDSISRQQGLKFSSGPPNTECYISSDIFYVEIELETSGEVKDVKIFHHGDPVTCPELVKVLRSGNFTEFTKHLEGLAAIYQLNADKKQKTKAYLALQALEEDLSMLAQLQSSINDPSNLVHKSPVGILQKRQGGYSLKLTYFISPYDLLDVETNSSIPLTVDAVIEKGLGNSVTVCIESSTSHKLQTTSLITVSKTAEGKSLPSFAALSNLNSTTLPANFVLKLPKPIPMAASLVKKIQGITKITDGTDLSCCQPLLSVIVKDTSNGKIAVGDQGLCVTLPDEHHCYFLSSSADLQGVMVSCIPFTHPTHVPQILVFLRQQMLFNTLISSCVRPSSKKDAESPFMFEVMAYSTSHIIISFEHPVEESLATVDLDLRDITNVKCKVFTLGSDQSMCTDEYASKIMQRCLSIPITMRAVIRKAHGQQQLIRSSNQSDMYCATVSSSGPVPYLSHIPYNSSLSNGSSFSGGDFSNLASRMCNKPNESSETFTKNSNLDNQSFGSSTGGLSPSSAYNLDPHVTSKTEVFSSAFDKTDSTSQNSSSASQGQYHQGQHANAMLRSMLSDVPSANPASATFPFLGHNDGTAKGKSRKRKRKGTEGRSSSTGRSPKRKSSEDDCGRDRSTPDVELCESPMGFDVSSSLPATFPSAREQHLSHTLATTDGPIKAEQTSHGYPQRSASTDSYLLHNDFQTRQFLNINDCSRLSEGGSSSNSDLLRGLSQVKGQYFGSSENLLEFNKGFLTNCETNFLDPTDASSREVDMDDSPDPNQCGVFLSKFNHGEKSLKKKKFKDKCEVLSESSEYVNYNSSDESSIGELSQKSFSETETSQSEDSSASISKANSGHMSQEMFVGTSLKIAKSGDSHKVSKSELKAKHKESKRSMDESRKKGDGKKEKKRKRAESSDLSTKSPVRSFHTNIDSSLMPPPASSSEGALTIASPSDSQPIRPITLNVKSSPVVTSSSTFQPKSTLSSKKSSSPSHSSGNFLKSGTSKSYPSEKIAKPSPPKSSNFSSVKMSGSESDGKKGQTGVKIPSKHKQSSGSKGSSNSTSGFPGGRSSPTKAKSVKLKNINLPSSITLTPIPNKSNLSNVNINASSDCGSLQSSPGDPGSPTGKSKASKAAQRSRKSSLSAVIDKLRVTATNAQHVIPGLENAKYEGAPRSDTLTDRKEPKSERKDNTKEPRDNSSVLKGSESKSKYSSSDQFTVKQSSQGIKLTVTKTRTTDGSSRSSKSKQTKNSSVSSSVSKPTSSSGSSKGAVATSAAKKMYPNPPPNMLVSTKVSNPGGNSQKYNVTTSQKTSSPSGTSSAMSPRTNSSGNSVPKSMTKHVTSSTQNKANPSSSKTFDKPDKKMSSVGESKLATAEKVSTSTVGLATSLMPPLKPPSAGDTSRSSSSGSTPKRIEGSPAHQSPRNLLTCESTLEDQDPFRTLINKSESCNNMDMVSKTDISGAIDYCKTDIIKKLEQEEKFQWVSSSSDIKPLIAARTSCYKVNPEAILSDNASFDFTSKMALEVTSSGGGKHENLINAVSSSEEITFSRTLKQTNKSNAQSEEDSSSPADGLIIDYTPDTPRLPKSPQDRKWSSPSSVTLNSSDDKCDKTEHSPGTFPIKSPYQRSPLKSPAQVKTPPSNNFLSSSLSQPSPYILDDELMDEALMTVGE